MDPKVSTFAFALGQKVCLKETKFIGEVVYRAECAYSMNRYEVRGLKYGELATACAFEPDFESVQDATPTVENQP